MKIYILALSVLLFASVTSWAQSPKININGGFETIDPKTNLPIGWPNKGPLTSYSFKLDSNVVHRGKYAVAGASIVDKPQSGAFSLWIPQSFVGKEVKLSAFIKTEDVKDNTGFYINTPGRGQENAGYANMANQKIKGTTDWKEYTLTLKYDETKATGLAAGLYLSGTGKVWIDDVRLFVDGTPIEQATTKVIELPKALKDTSFSKSSGIVLASVSEQEVKNLTLLGQVWGFLKYHHTAITKGEHNMDAELFRVMPGVIKAKDSKEASAVIEQWVDKFGVPEKCAKCKPYKGSDITIKPDYGRIFDNSVVSPTLISKLTYILDNRSQGESHYMSMIPQIGNPDITNEFNYSYMTYPDAGYRLLSLFRYWNIIQYFFPYRDIIGRDWNEVLPELIPKFAAAQNTAEYHLAALTMIAQIHDTHGNLWSTAMEQRKGINSVPFGATFVEKKLVVTAYYNDTLDVKEKLKIGDVITSINGEKVEDLIKKYQPITAASNYETQLRDMPSTYLLRTDKPQFDIVIARDGKTIQQSITTMPSNKVKVVSPFSPDPKMAGYKLLDDQIGYVFPGRYFNKDLPQIKELFKNTKGIVIDMRCYPSEFMPFTFVPYVKTGKQDDFVRFTSGHLEQPGLFTMSKPLVTKGSNEYKGKVVVIVNEYSQSQAEYTTMAFQSSANVKVIGGMTAAADGNVSPIPLPGGLRTFFSGLGVFYPNGTPTQRVGIKLDERIDPTIACIKAGKDELLERAKAIILE
ncbi:S41 family peptidase [Mucilaginibacter myungsuensis]|uniref:Peptidase S41 n=1 Tax=Mucilaginibacter myungsuensis TaxID=649104 RepID=A0A929L0I3_9SPHI|nr:S41 family peptidase [Mucilaginibacter myungsuensis]MBE9664587.1 peptidase S41 [Mucilaginibacter myungsuensis]MDN3601063.1 S41 family peptidase [Mucilaginibacter myungsuensis]